MARFKNKTSSISKSNAPLAGLTRKVPKTTKLFSKRVTLVIIGKTDDNLFHQEEKLLKIQKDKLKHKNKCY